MRKPLTEKAKTDLRAALRKNDYSDVYLARAYNTTKDAVQRVKLSMNRDNYFYIPIPICGLEKKTEYIPPANGLTSEEQMLSCPFYNPMRGDTWETPADGERYLKKMKDAQQDSDN